MHRFKDSRRRLTLAAVPIVAALSLAATSTCAQAAQARPAWSGGGCVTSTQAGFSVGACISGSGSSSISDAYVNAKPNGCYWMEIDQRDSHGTLVARGAWQNVCAPGHYRGPSFNGVNNWGPFFTEVTVVAGGRSYVFQSPYLNAF